MSWIRPLLTVLLVTVWVPAPQHSVEWIRLYVLLDCSQPPAGGGESPVQAGGLAVVESDGACAANPLARRVAMTSRRFAPLAALAAVPPAISSQANLSPSDVAVSWRFLQRVAGSPRAPSAVS